MTLTEIWKKGELPESDYYIKAGDTILTDFYGGGNFCLIPEKNISEILGKVPNFEEYQALLSDTKTLAQTLLKVSPEHREWLEKNYKEYL